MDKIKAWFRNSTTILWARMQSILGILSAGLIFGFSSYDFTSLASMDTKAAFKIVVCLAISGVVTEICRRRTLPPA